MLNTFFLNDLATFRKFAAAFFHANPSQAPFLDKPSTDPDVERILEAIIYRNSMLYRLKDESLPELVNDLTRLVLPHFSKIIPGCTILAFIPTKGCTETTRIRSGAVVETSEIDGPACRFTIKSDLEIHPLQLTDAQYIKQPGRSENTIRLSFSLIGTTLNRWKPKGLRIFLSGDHSTACELYRLLHSNVSRIILTPFQGGTTIELSPEHLKPAGFDDNEALLPYPSNSFPGYRLLMEYFNIPDNFLFFTLTGWDKFLDCGEGSSFTIDFELSDTPAAILKIRPDNFVINSCVAVNIFKIMADPITITHRKEKYHLRCAGSNPDHYNILSVDSVTGYQRKTHRQRSYLPFNLFADDSTAPIYNITQEKSHHGPGMETTLSVVYPKDMPEAGSETLSIDLTASNGILTESIHIGDVRIPVSGIPDSVIFRNISPVTHSLIPPTGIDRLALFNTRIILNQLPQNADNLKMQLKQLFYSDQRSGSAMEANLKRIDGIESMTITPAEKYVAGLLMKGSLVNIKISQDNFTGHGDLYLFCCILDNFLGQYAATNSFTQLAINETKRGAISQWPMRLGNCNNKTLAFTPGTFPVTGESYNLQITTDEPLSEPDNIAALMDDLIANGHEFGFYSAMQLARIAVTSNNTGEEKSETTWLDRVRVIGDLSFGFPTSDIKAVKQLAHNLIQITASFSSLYGTSSPLPSFYTTDLFEEASEDSSVSRDFLDIYNRPWFALLYLIWCSRHLLIKIADEKNPSCLQKLYSLIGMAEIQLRHSVPDSLSYLRYSGIINQANSTASGLQTILRDSFGIDCITVEQCVQRKVPIPRDQQWQLGNGMRLGMDMVIGSEISCRTGKFRIHIGPLKKKLHDSFLPTGSNHTKLIRIIRMCERSPLQYDLKLTLASGEAKPIKLGDPDGNGLGWGTILFSGFTCGEVSSIYQLSEWPLEPLPEPEESNSEPDEPRTLMDYYQKARSDLDDNFNDFLVDHDKVSTMVSGHVADPSIERLTQGAALSNGLVKQNMDDDIPEVMHDIMDNIHPNSLRPSPATTTIIFTPKASCTGPQIIPAGTLLKSVPVDGVECLFTTSYPVEILPLSIMDVAFTQLPGKDRAITISLQLFNMRLTDLKLNKLRLSLIGERDNALNLNLVLLRYVKRVVIKAGGRESTLAVSCLKAVGFEDTDLLFPTTAVSGNIQMLQEYFNQPDRFLFIDLLLDTWRGHGDGTEFEISFELESKLPVEIHKVSKADFALFGTPAVNLFKHQAEPINLEDYADSYPVVPIEKTPGNVAVYSVENVFGIARGRAEDIKFEPNRLFNSNYYIQTPVYSLTRIKSPMHHTFDMFISIKEPKNNDYKPAILLSINLLCTNGPALEKLNVGDISVKTDSSPKFAEYYNCKPVTRSKFVNMGNNAFWRLYSICNLNLSLLNIQSLRAVLETVSRAYINDYITAKLNTKQIQGIVDFQIKATDRFVGMIMARGWEIRIRLNREAYSSLGDLYLFGALLDNLLRGFVSQSCFTKTTIEVVQTDLKYEWPAKMERRVLL